MAQIVCPECKKEVTVFDQVCPYCGAPISPRKGDGTTSPPKKVTRYLLVGLLVLLALAITGWNLYVAYLDPEAAQVRAYEKAVRRYNSGDYVDAMYQLEALGDYQNAEELALSSKYNLAYQAMESRDWQGAVFYLRNLDYEDSEKMLTDCNFMIDLRVTIQFYLENASNPDYDEKILLSADLAGLEKYKEAEFFDAALGICATEYIEGLQKQLEALDYDRNSEYQVAWYGGLVVRLRVLDLLYREYNFMEDNLDFVGTYINHLEFYEKWFDAMCAMEINGHKQVKAPVANRSYIELYFRNDTYHTSTQTFEVKFWRDEDQKMLLGTSYATVENIDYYGDYTVLVNVPAAVGDGRFYYSCSHYYEEIVLN